MKVVHIASSITGGAGAAAFRLHRALLKSGVDSVMLTRRDDIPQEFIYKMKPPFWVRLLGHFIQPTGRLKYHSFYRRACQRFLALSFPDYLYDLSHEKILEDADVIHLHWVGSMLNYKKFFACIKKPLVWTLHDMNPFLGVAHCTYDCDNNVADKQFLHIERRAAQYKRAAYAKCSNLSIVCLCEWMKKESEHSQAFSQRSHHIVRNCIDDSWFAEHDKTEMRTKYQLPQDKKIILYIAHAHTSQKGVAFVSELLTMLPSDCVILTLGRGSLHSPCNNVINIGYVSEIHKLQELYAAADVLLLPSVEDNLPNTMLEALSTGVPVVCFPVGGMKDIIIEGCNGVFAEETSARGLLSAFKKLFEEGLSWTPQEIRAAAKEQFSENRIAERYTEIYNSVI